MSARYFCNALHADWWRRRDKSGGQLVEQVIHMVDLMRYLMGDPVTVYSLQNNLFHRDVADYTVEDVSGTVIGFKNGGIGVIYASNGAIPGKWINDYRLVARNLTAEFSDANHATFTYTGGPYLQNVSISSDQDYYRLELSDLLKAIETGGNVHAPARGRLIAGPGPGGYAFCRERRSSKALVSRMTEEVILIPVPRYTGW